MSSLKIAQAIGSEYPPRRLIEDGICPGSDVQDSASIGVSVGCSHAPFTREKENIMPEVCLNRSLTFLCITAFALCSLCTQDDFHRISCTQESRERGSVPTPPTALTYGLGQTLNFFVLQLPPSEIAPIIFFWLFSLPNNPPDITGNKYYTKRLCQRKCFQYLLALPVDQAQDNQKLIF